ncbi:MAG: YihY/virulence factor BrkB family protein [Ruminococcaceae bacterium]|nr:YihY/virulence factor BrkB family protein [Oscillospiraceae bacterium]
MILQFMKRIQKNELWNVAAQLSYYLLLSFFPLMIGVVSLLDYFPVGIDMLMDVLESVVPDPVYELVVENAELFSGLRGRMFSVGFIVTLVIATRSSVAIYKSLNHSYTAPKRHFLVAYLISFGITLSLILFVVFSLTFILFSNRFILQFLTNSTGMFWFFRLRILGMFVVFVLGLSAMYAFVPRIKLKLKEVLPGAIIATVLWIISTVGFEIYVKNFGNYALIYGTLGSFVVLLLWLYLVSFALLLGNEINAFLYERKENLQKPLYF